MFQTIQEIPDTNYIAAFNKWSTLEGKYFLYDAHKFIEIYHHRNTDINKKHLIDKQCPCIYEDLANRIINYVKCKLPCFIDGMHVGSTSIPNIKNRPIITINIAVSSVQEAHKYLSYFTRKGWKIIIDHDEEILLQKAITSFHELMNGCMGYQIYFITKNNRQWIFKRDFRDYMRANPLEAKQYEQFKIDLWNEMVSLYSDDLHEANRKYGCSKAPFILEILKRCGHTNLKLAPPNHVRVIGQGCILGDPSHE